MDPTLAARIAALAEEQPAHIGRARVLDLRRGVTEALLDEIDATVLAATLLFETETKSLRLKVAGRRLLSVVEGDDVADAALAGQALGSPNAEHVQFVAGVLSDFTSEARSLRVTSTPERAEAGGDSISVEALEAAMGLETDAPDASISERFLKRAEGHIKALLHLDDGTVTATKGAIAQVQSLKIALTTQLSPYLEAREANCPSHTDPSIIFCQDTISEGVGLAVGVIGSEVLLLAYQSGNMTALATAWRRVN